ncbi:hypothetical protein V6Z96_007952 [Aspergillus fumigatus]|jgi:hypothetical protein
MLLMLLKLKGTFYIFIPSFECRSPEVCIMTVSVWPILFFGDQVQRRFFLDLLKPAPQDVWVCWGDPASSRCDTEPEDIVTADSLRETGITQSQHCRVKIRLSLMIHKLIWSNCKRRDRPAAHDCNPSQFKELVDMPQSISHSQQPK